MASTYMYRSFLDKAFSGVLNEIKNQARYKVKMILLTGTELFMTIDSAESMDDLAQYEVDTPDYGGPVELNVTVISDTMGVEPQVFFAEPNGDPITAVFSEGGDVSAEYALIYIEDTDAGLGWKPAADPVQLIDFGETKTSVGGSFTVTIPDGYLFSISVPQGVPIG